MKNVKAVIGANFGDEGKGAITNHFSQDWADIVVRFNGGSQAAHTVKNDNGFHHVFGHFTSGTGEGIPSYYGKDFIVNPFIFFRELESLERKKSDIPVQYYDPECLVTTLYDMYINRVLERIRASNKHGSCGLGINETVERSLKPKYSIKLKDIIKDIDDVSVKVFQILTEYYPARLRSILGDSYHLLDKDDIEILSSHKMFVDTINTFRKFVECLYVEVVPSAILRSYDNVLFEGAQGLLLDESHEFFPHVTRSKTGFHNVQSIIDDVVLKELETCDVYYVSRCYMTRHGAGPFPTEQDISEFVDVVDPTNIPNEFQDHLRTGALDVDMLCDAIKGDMKNIKVPHNYHLVITCVDQLKQEEILVKYKGKEGCVYFEELIYILHKDIDLEDISYTSSPITGSLSPVM